MKHNSRFYREYSNGPDTAFNVKIDTSDLFIRTGVNLYYEAYEALKTERTVLENYISAHEEFIHSLYPITPDGNEEEIISAMYIASAAAGVGPMAAVAGAVAERVGRELLKFSDEVLVENGGDIWMKLKNSAVIGIYVNNIYFKNSIGIKINPENTPCSVCTSTSKLGHSISFGKADSVTVIAESGALADAAATAVCNMVQSEDDIEAALEYAIAIDGVRGCLIVFRDKLAARGEIELAPLN
jgi:hypothetical protein